MFTFAKLTSVTMTLRLKPFLLAGVATIATTVATLALTHATPAMADPASAPADAVAGRLSAAPPSGIKAPDVLMAAEAEDSLMTAPSAPGDMSFVPAAKPMLDANMAVDNAYNAAEAMAAALVDTRALAGHKLTDPQLATLPTDMAESNAADTTPAVTEEIEAEATEATETTETIEIFSGDVPLRHEVITLPPVPSAKPAGTVSKPRAGNSQDLMRHAVADQGDTPLDTVLGAISADKLSPVQVAEFAQTRSVIAGDLPEIIARAIANHPQVLGRQAEFRASEEAVREERSNLFPTFSAEGFSGYRNTDNRTTRGRATRGANGDGDVSAWATEGTLRLSQLIYDFGTTPNSIDAARSRLGESQFLEADSQEQIGLRAVDAYLSVLQSTANRGFAQLNVDFHIQTLNDVTQRANAGAGDEGDVRQTESRLALAREFLFGFEEALDIAKADFIEAVGEAPGDLAPVGVPAEPVPATVADALTIAIEENPFINAASFAAEGVEHEADAAFGAFYPRFDLDVSYTRGDDVNGIGGRDEETRALVRMVWDIPTGGGEIATRKRLENLQEAAEQEQEERIRLIEEEVRSSYAEVEKTRLQVEQLEIRVEAANGVVDAYQQQFSAGRRTLLDLLDSENERFLARVALNNGQTDLIRSHYRLFAAMGRLRQVLALPDELADTPLR